MYDEASDEFRPGQIRQMEHLCMTDRWMDEKWITNSIPKL
jgi:hypothetical protein